MLRNFYSVQLLTFLWLEIPLVTRIIQRYSDTTRGYYTWETVYGKVLILNVETQSLWGENFFKISSQVPHREWPNVY